MRYRSRPMRSTVSLVLCLAIWVPLISAAGDRYVPTDEIFLSCGASSGQSSDSDGREWASDVGSKFLSSADDSTTDTAATQDPSVPEVPYMTARVFRSRSTYTFPVAAGRKFLRLYFYPSTYSKLDANAAVFSVSSGEFTLLSNFSAAQTAEALNFAYIVKEYSLNVVGATLNITFAPSPNVSHSHAFVNGIEIVSMPDIYSSSGDASTAIVGLDNSPYTIENSTALETLYRLNAGGNGIPVANDTGMYRSWDDDTPYIYGAAVGIASVADAGLKIKYPSGMPGYVAPVNVYSTARTMGPDPNVNKNYNLTWLFTVDPGFFYLLRLHFCEVSDDISKPNQRVFDIFINNQTAQAAADVILWAGGNGVPVYKDYVVFVAQGSPQQDLWLALHPNASMRPEYMDAILNGVEVFKLSDTGNNSLAGPNPVPAPKPAVQSPPGVQPVHHSKNRGPIVGGVVGGGIAVALLLGFLVLFAHRLRGRGKSPNASTGWLPLSLYGSSHSSASSAKSSTIAASTASSAPSNCRHFSFAEIKAATNKFDESLILGVGGFGKVYKGALDGGATKVAIKRANPLSEQGVREFQTEIELLSKLRHRHLVSLIGYCEEKREMILVYDYMAYGTLREHLYKTDKPPLPWKKRLEICIGAARGLHYLHTGAKHTIIHRDVKTTNILLDEKWVAKVADFGLSKTGPALDHTHVSTVVKGSFGYLDPEYFRRQQLTDKSDVYSFGVVLFEIISARPALNPTLPKEQVSLAEWALHCQKKGTVHQIVDPYLTGKIAPECLNKFVETAVKCLSDVGYERPSMGDVLWCLEFALQLQESAEENGIVIVEAGEFAAPCGGKKDSNGGSPDYDGKVMDSRSSGITMSIGGQSLASADSDGLTPSAVFSQILNPKGR